MYVRVSVCDNVYVRVGVTCVCVCDNVYVRVVCAQRMPGRQLNGAD